MESEAIDWDQDLPLDAVEAYRSLVRSLRRTDGFSLLFVRCSPVQGDQITKDVQSDLPEKTIEVMQLDQSIDNLYDRVLGLPNCNQLNILFIKGLEYSIYEYEDREYGDINLRSRGEVYSGSWKNVPRIFGHLNLNRERFRDNFPICFVFLIPEFVLKYFIRRAPDFFDWRSNIFEFPTNREVVEKASKIFLEDNDWEKYISLSYQERVERMIQIRAWSDEDCQSSDQKARLLREYGRLLSTDNKKCEDVLAYFDEAAALNPDFHEAWNSRGIALRDLGRYEEALACYDKAIEIKPDYFVWDNRGDVLRNLGRYEEALASYDKAIEIKPDYYYSLFSRGYVLRALTRYEEAIISFDKAVEIEPDDNEVWHHRGIVLSELEKHEEAIASYDKALQFKPDDHEAWNNRAIALGNLGRNEEEIASYDKALQFKPDDHEVWYNRGIVLGNLGRDEEAIASFDRALEIKPDYHYAWSHRGATLCDYLGRNEEAIASFYKALQFKPDDHDAWYGRGNALGNLGRNEEALASYDRALEIKPDYHEVWGNRGILLRQLGRNEEAIASYDKVLQFKPDKHEAWYNRGNALGNLGRNEEAITSYDRALEIKPDYHEAWGNRGFVLGNLGRYEEAIASYEKALELTDNINKKVEIIQIISSLYYRSGKIREGLATTQRINEFSQDMNIPMSEILLIPQWMKKLIKFGERGKMQEFIFSGLVIISVPIWLPVAICILIFRVVSQLAMRMKP